MRYALHQNSTQTSERKKNLPNGGRAPRTPHLDTPLLVIINLIGYSTAPTSRKKHVYSDSLRHNRLPQTLSYGGRDVRININDIKIINIYDFSLISMIRTISLRIDIYILCLMATVSKRAGKSKQLSAKRLGQRLWNSPYPIGL